MELRHEKLEVWQIAMDLTDAVYRFTKQFPLEERFGLTDQVRRSAVSVALNIAEGASRGSKKDFSHFLRMATASLMETDTGLKIALRQGYLKKLDYEQIYPLIEKLYFKLFALQKSLKTS